MEDDIEWLSTAQVADMLGISVRTLYRLINTGDVPAYRMGRVIRLRRGDVLEFIAGSRIRSSTNTERGAKRKEDAKENLSLRNLPADGMGPG